MRWKWRSILRPYVLQIISDGDFTYLVKRARSGYRFLGDGYACRMRRQSLGAALNMGSVCCLSYYTISMKNQWNSMDCQKRHLPFLKSGVGVSASMLRDDLRRTAAISIKMISGPFSASLPATAPTSIKKQCYTSAFWMFLCAILGPYPFKDNSMKWIHLAFPLALLHYSNSPQRLYNI